MSTDREYVDILSIFHYVLAGLMALVGCFPIIHLGFGIAIVSGILEDHGQGPPAFFGWFFIAVALFLMSLAWTLTVCLLMVGRKLSRRKSYMFCLVVAGIECVFVPLGTILGVFTIIALMRPGVKRMFGEKVDADATAGPSDV
jgi:hypothetical protein